MTSAPANSAALLSVLIEIAKHARQDCYAAFDLKHGSGYRLVRSPVSDDVVRRHLSGVAPIAVYPVAERATRVAVLDIDNHDGALTWNEVVARTLPLLGDLIGAGLKPVCFRSSGGSGIHVWLFWQTPQSARLVRRFLAKALARQGLRAGMRGIAAGEVEVYPKQDEVAEAGVGNPIALPLARKSIPLDNNFSPIELDAYRPPNIEGFYCPAAPDDKGVASSPDAGSAVIRQALSGPLVL